MSGGVTSLDIGRTGQRGNSDDVSDCIDMGLSCLKVFVDIELSAVVGLDTGVFKSQSFGVTGATIGPEKHIAFELFSGLEMHDNVIIEGFESIEGFVVADANAGIAHVIGEGIADFVIEKFKHAGAGVDEIEFDVEVSEHGCIFAADDAGTINRHGFGCFRKVQNGVAVEDTGVAEVNIGWPIGA